MMKLFKIFFSVLAPLIFLIVSSCKKSEGDGGQASITGKIWVKKYNATGTAIAGEFEGAYEDVYIIYGDDVTYGDRLETNPDGIYEFKYLRPGDYKIYAYSTGPSLTTNRLAVIKNISIAKKKETVDAGTITIVK